MYIFTLSQSIKDLIKGLIVCVFYATHIYLMKDSTKTYTRNFLNRSATLLLSLLALQIAFVSGKATNVYEPFVGDMFFRWRYNLMKAQMDPSDKDICLIGIDAQTQDSLGRLGAGQWIARIPYSRQMNFFVNHDLKPTVLGYDIILEDTIGFSGRSKEEVSSSAKAIDSIITEMLQLKENGNESLASPKILEDINRFSAEQGNQWLSQFMSELATRRKLKPILGYYFRGGWIAPQSGRLTPWTQEDISGDSKDGDENGGKQIPYLKDIAIHPDSIQFDSDEDKSSYDYSLNAKLPAKELLDYSRLGFLNCPRDPDNVVRRVPMLIGFKYINRIKKTANRVFVPSFALMSCLQHLGVQFPLNKESLQVNMGREIVINSPKGVYRIPIDKSGRIFINCDAKLEDFYAVNFIDVSAHSYNTATNTQDLKVYSSLKQKIDNRMLMVGVTSAGLDDGATAISSRTPMIVVHMLAANNILRQSFIAPLDERGTIVLYAILFIAFTTLCYIEKGARLGITSILFLLLYITIAFVMVASNIVILPVILPSIYMIAGCLSIVTLRFFTEQKARRKIHGMFATMVSDNVLKYLEENPESFSLTGHNANISVMFSDVANFTAMSEALPASRVSELLNTYFTPVSECILRSGGYLDKYIGDGIMAVWGAPYPDKDHAKKACSSALEQMEVLDDIRKIIKKEYGFDLKIRIGINSGTAIAGNMGSARKFQYTVMGDTVNFAARIEPANKEFGTDIIIGKSTYDAVKDIFLTRELARIIVVGKMEVVPVYELVGFSSKNVTDQKLMQIKSYEEALGYFYNREWTKCEGILHKIKSAGDDAPTDFLMAQVIQFKNTEPPAEWKGEYKRAVKG